MQTRQIDTSHIPCGDILYRFALDCAEHKIRNTCDFNCRVCPSNISKYAIDRQTAVMLQHCAELEMGHRIQIQHQYRMDRLEYEQAKQNEMRPIGVIALIQIMKVLIVIIVVLCFAKIPKSNTSAIVVPTNTTTPMPSPPVITPPVKPAADPLVPIRDTLRRIQVADMDGDGLRNCIDYAIQFYNIYPDRNKVRIIHNDNKETGWSHLFVSVDGIMVEPSAYLDKTNIEKWFGMSKFWGAEYDPGWNKDITYDIERIKAGTRW